MKIKHEEDRENQSMFTDHFSCNTDVDKRNL